MEANFNDALKLIESSGRVLLTMHERMDGDDGGSVLAMRQALVALGKQVTCVIKFGVPEQLEFLPGSEHILENTNKLDFDLLIMFGCSTKKRCGLENLMELKCPVINIDHHQDNELYGEVSIVQPEISSVAELLYNFFIFAKWPISTNTATCLLTGIITDTGSFRHSNTAASTLKVAAELMKKGALIDKIVKKTFRSKTIETLKAWGKAMENSFYQAEQKIMYSIMTEEDLASVGQLPQAAFEGFVETLNSVPEAKFAIFLRQDGDVIKGSLRSDSFKKINVAEIAKIFGGGGHIQAAGFSVIGKLEKNQLGQWKVI